MNTPLRRGGVTFLNCHNCRTGNDIVMTLGPIIKPDKRNMIRSKKIDDDVKLANYIVINICVFIADSEHCRTWIPGAWSIVLTFSLKSTFYLTKAENL